jgi:hypothetical protein
MNKYFFVCLLSFLTFISCGSDDDDDNKTQTTDTGTVIGTVSDKVGVMNKDQSSVWYIKCTVDQTIDEVEMYFPISLADSLKQEGKIVTFSGLLYKRDATGLPAGTKAYNISLTRLYKMDFGPSLLPVVKYYSVAEFHNLLKGGTWYESQAYDVYADGTVGKEILGELIGYAGLSFTAVSNTELSLYIEVVDPTVDDYHGKTGYSFELGNKFQFAYNSHLSDFYHKPMTVLEINDSLMRCQGVVFSEKWAPDAVAGLYVFRKTRE